MAGTGRSFDPALRRDNLDASPRCHRSHPIHERAGAHQHVRNRRPPGLPATLTAALARAASGGCPARERFDQRADNAAVFVDVSRITTPLATLTALASDIDSFLTTTLAPLVADPVANRGQIIAQVDSLLAHGSRRPVGACGLAGAGAASSGWGFALNSGAYRIRGCLCGRCETGPHVGPRS